MRVAGACVCEGKDSPPPPLPHHPLSLLLSHTDISVCRACARREMMSVIHKEVPPPPIPFSTPPHPPLPHTPSRSFVFHRRSPMIAHPPHTPPLRAERTRVCECVLRSQPTKITRRSTSPPKKKRRCKGTMGLHPRFYRLKKRATVWCLPFCSFPSLLFSPATHLTHPSQPSPQKQSKKNKAKKRHVPTLFCTQENIECSTANKGAPTHNTTKKNAPFPPLLLSNNTKTNNRTDQHKADQSNNKKTRYLRVLLSPFFRRQTPAPLWEERACQPPHIAHNCTHRRTVANTTAGTNKDNKINNNHSNTAGWRSPFVHADLLVFSVARIACLKYALSDVVLSAWLSRTRTSPFTHM
eukprot:Rhum_TRINITY_DN18914_c0_g1::Rhum_TRINITY_DN18914_c0_g1_i1::g.168828::m.168828